MSGIPIPQSGGMASRRASEGLGAAPARSGVPRVVATMPSSLTEEDTAGLASMVPTALDEHSASPPEQDSLNPFSNSTPRVGHKWVPVLHNAAVGASRLEFTTRTF